MTSRIADSCATLTDHIYYFDGTNCKFGGNLWCDISDHLPNFCLITKQMSCAKSCNRPLIRIYSKNNIRNFTSQVYNMSFDEVFIHDYVDTCYNLFISKITTAFDNCFKPVRLSRSKSKDKAWITSGIKNSIKKQLI